MLLYNNAEPFLELLKRSDPLFLLTISYTETAEIDGITVAGANKELVKYTPAADAEFIHYGYCKCIDVIPATPDGKPTPALLTRAALKAADIPMLVVDAGSKIKPKMPYLSIDAIPSHSIERSKALDRDTVEQIYTNSIELGKTLGKLCRFIIIGESIPGGTTTALAVLLSMGIDARFKVSSSMPNNPHTLKIKVVEDAMKRARIDIGSLKDDPLEAISYFGDAMMATVSGIVIGAKQSKIMLAGGTQMTAILSIIKGLNKLSDNLMIGTTKYIVDDEGSDIIELIRAIGDIPIVAVDPMLDRSSKDGLRAYANGFVKEGAGAGGACIAALTKTNIDLLAVIEEEYKVCIESNNS